MNRRQMVLALALGAVGMGTVAPSAEAQIFDRFDRYRTYRWFGGHDSNERRQREFLRTRMMDIGERTETAARNRHINRRDADRVFDRLDRVADFLRNDRNLTDSEF